ncbi:UNVERIFIED_CONTAM: cytochrome [Sesamum calycinum]|uniref:Cytochrome n=1 Tax=Sesamum calycinum TaxID=2727403 RepID=A0AAW2SZ96_9LAMI
MDILYAVFCIITIAVLLLFILFSALVLRIFIGKSIRNLSYPPVVGTVFDQLFYFNRLYDYQTEMAKRHKTSRLLAPDQSEIYTTEPRNIEHILKTNFSNYSKGQYNQDILTDLFGQGIFIVDGDKWRQQRKLASFEFSTRVLRDFSCSVFRKNAAKLVGTIYEFSKNNQVFDIQNDKEDILSRFLVESKKDPGTMTDQYLRDIILNFMIAGKDTTANTLSWFIYVLCKNPLIQENVAQEVRRVIRSPQNEDSVDNFVESITDEALEEMHYLHATLTETLRLYPAVPVDGRCAETDDTLPDGFKLKKGDGVYYMAYAMGRMAYIWGDDAEEFKPERWLKNGTFQPESPFKFVAFNNHAYTSYQWEPQHSCSSKNRKLQGKKKYHPIGGTVFNQLLNFYRLHDYMADLAVKYKTYRLIALFGVRDLTIAAFWGICLVMEFSQSMAISGGSREKCQALSFLQVAFGVELDSLGGSNEEGAKFSVAVDEVSMRILWRYVDVLWKLKRALNVGSEAKLKKSLQVVDEFVYKLIHSRIQQMNMPGNDSVMRLKKDDILSRFLQLTEANPKYLRDITISFIVAGKDTTATTLSWFIYTLCKYPHIQENVAQEIKDATGCKERVDILEFAACLTDETLEKMHYLHAALTETLRIYPAVPVDAKQCLCDDIMPDGFSVKKGDMVAYQPYAMGRMKSIWGNDAEEFKPERWLDKNGCFQHASPFKFTAFQAGLRLCLGKDFAYRQMKIFSALLLRFFTVKLSDDRKAVKYRPMLTLLIDGGLIVRIFHRMDAKTA